MSPVSRPRPEPWAVSSLCRDCLSGQSELGGNGRLCQGSLRDPGTGLAGSGQQSRGVARPHAKVPARPVGEAGGGDGTGWGWTPGFWERAGSADTRVPKVPKGGYFPRAAWGRSAGWRLGGRRGVAGAELGGEPGPPGPALRRARRLPRSSISPLPPASPAPLDLSTPRPSSPPRHPLGSHHLLSGGIP